MPMMRRGPLDRYPPEWVLRQANAHQAEGSIEFHTDHPATLYLTGGRVYAAERGVSLDEQALTDRSPRGEQAVRQGVVTILSDVLGTSSGWYFHDPLGHHPTRGSWSWETAALLMDTRASSHEATGLATWADRRVVLHETPAASITLGPDAWAVVVQLAESASAGELRAQLGWSPDRLVSALVEIEDRGVLDPGPALRPPPPPPTSAPPPPSASAPVGSHTGPLAPPPPLASTSAPAAARRRSVLPGRRTSGS